MVSLNYHVGCDQNARRYSKTKCLGGLSVDHQLELGGKQYWQIGRARTFENSTCVHPCLAISVCVACTVTNQTTLFDLDARVIHGGHPITRSQRQYPLALGTEKRVSSNEKRFNFRARNIFEGRFDIT